MDFLDLLPPSSDSSDCPVTEPLTDAGCRHSNGSDVFADMMKYGFRFPPLGLQESRLEEYKGIRERRASCWRWTFGITGKAISCRDLASTADANKEAVGASVVHGTR